MLREIAIGVIGAIAAGLILAAAEELFGALSAYVGAVPSGAVMAFENECPDGWALYHNGKGRFLLGAGQADDGEGTAHKLRSTGGEERVALEMAEMPRHRHDDLFGDGNANHLLVQVTGDLTEKHTDSRGTNQINIRHGVRMQPRGEGKSHENMPPYRAVNFCMKK